MLPIYNDPFRTAHNIQDHSISQINLSKILSDYGLDLGVLINKDTIDVRNSSVSVLLKYGWTKEEIIKSKGSYKAEDLDNFTNEEIEKWNLLDKSEISRKKLGEYSDDEIIQKGLLFRCNRLYLHDVLEYITNPKFEKIVRENIYKLYHDKRFSDIIAGEKPKFKESGSTWHNRLDNFRVGEYSLFSRDDGNQYSLELTLFNLIWNNVTSKDCTLEEIAEIIKSRDGLGEYESEPLLKTIKWMGFDLENESEIFKFIKDIRTNSQVICKTLKKMGYEKYRDVYFNEWNSNKHYFREYDFSNLKGFLTDGQLGEIKECNDTYDYNQELNRLFTNKYPDESDCKEFYSKWKTHVQRWDKIDRFNKSWRRVEINVHTILLYSKIDKLSELNKLEFPLSWDFIGKLDHEISYPMSVRKKPFEYFLNLEQRKKIYYFMTSMNLEDINIIHYYGGEKRRYRRKEYFYQTSMFLFDRESFDEYVEEVSKMKNNHDDYNYSDGGFKNEKFITYRIRELSPIISFFVQTEQKEECIKLVKEIASWDMKIPELKLSLDVYNEVDYISNIFARKYYEFTKSPGVKSKLSKYIITEWNRFKK